MRMNTTAGHMMRMLAHTSAMTRSSMLRRMQQVHGDSDASMCVRALIEFVNTNNPR